MYNVVSFHNPMKVPFTFHWDKEPYIVAPGETIQLPDFLAIHGTKHLVDYIILHKETWPEVCPHREKLGTSADDVRIGRDELEKIIQGEVTDTVKDPEVKTGGQKMVEEVAALNKRGPGRPKKEDVVKPEEREFEDLDMRKLT